MLKFNKTKKHEYFTQTKPEVEETPKAPNKVLKKAKIVGKVAGFTVTTAFFIYLGIAATMGVTNFFDTYTLRFDNPVEVYFNKPVVVVTREQDAAEREQKRKVDEAVDKCFNMLMEVATPSATPSAKQSSIVPQAHASDIYTYAKHQNKPHYDQIMAKIKTLYTNWEDAAELIARESGFDPGAINPSSGACGLPQALPCKKMKCSLSDIDCQLEWQKDYIANRYGTVTEALSFQIAHNSY